VISSPKLVKIRKEDEQVVDAHAFSITKPQRNIIAFSGPAKR
jgi:hypothetical protein